MTKQIITTDRAPSSPLFSQGVKVGSTIYVAGMAGIDPATGQVAGRRADFALLRRNA
jgi:2-iminobutanoate/2-iminopropanoate deaminase